MKFRYTYNASTFLKPALAPGRAFNLKKKYLACAAKPAQTEGEQSISSFNGYCSTFTPPKSELGMYIQLMVIKFWLPLARLRGICSGHRGRFPEHEITGSNLASV
jgi:hypothetical protein